MAITGGLQSGEDLLLYRTQNDISGSYNLSTGVLTLTGTASVAAYQAALRSVQYENASDTPNTATRTISFTANDGANVSAAATRDLTVTAVNDAPEVGGVAATVAYAEQAAATKIAGDLTIADPDSTTLSSATVTLTGRRPGDSLSFSNTLGLNTVTTTGTDTITLRFFSSNGASVDTFRDALRTVTFASSSDNPGTSRTVGITANDGVANSASVSTTIAITPENDAPRLTGPKAILAAGSEDTAYTVTRGQLLAGYADPEGDALSVTGLTTSSGTVTASQDGASYTVTPAADFNGAVTLAYGISDGSLTTPATQTFTLAAVNDAPVIDLNGAAAGVDNTAAYTEGGTPATLAADLTVADVDAGARIAGAVVSIGAGFITGADRLTVGGPTTGSSNSISFAYDATTGRLTFTTAAGQTATPEEYRFLLAQVQFDTTADNPGSSRTIGWTVDDGTATSAAASTTLTVTPTNDAPVLSAPTSASVGFAEDATTPTALFAGTQLTDPDQPASFVGGSLTLSTTGEGGIDLLAASAFAVVDGNLVLRSTPSVVLGAVTGAGSTSVAVTGLTAEATAARVQDLVDDFGYSNAGQNPIAGTRTVTLTVNDGGNTGGGALSATQTQTLTVTATNDAPVNAVPAEVSYAPGSGGGLVPDLSIRDVDAGSGSLITRLEVVNGVLTVANPQDGAVVQGSGSTSVTLTGTVDAINRSLGGVGFRGIPGLDATLTVTTSDGGNTGTGGILTDIDQARLRVPSAPVEPGPEPTPDPTPTPVLTPAPAPGASGGDDNLAGTERADAVLLLSGNDTYLGLGGDDLVQGNAGADLLLGNQGRDTLYGGMDSDTLFGGQDGDLLYGDRGNDLVLGNQGDDTLQGNMGADTLFGGQGNDLLYGGQGDDVLHGDLGDDVLFGDLGADRLVFGLNSGSDAVFGFRQADGDRLDLQGQTYTFGTAADGSGSALLVLSGGGSVQLVGITQGQVNQSFFV